MSAFFDDDVIMAAIFGLISKFFEFFEIFQLKRLQGYVCNGVSPLCSFFLSTFTENNLIAQMTSFKLANFCQNITPKSLISMKLHFHIKFVAKVNQKLQNVHARPSLNANLTWKRDFH